VNFHSLECLLASELKASLIGEAANLQTPSISLVPCFGVGGSEDDNNLTSGKVGILGLSAYGFWNSTKVTVNP
jgi:hypothetical protein